MAVRGSVQSVLYTPISPAGRKQEVVPGSKIFNLLKALIYHPPFYKF